MNIDEIIKTSVEGKIFQKKARSGTIYVKNKIQQALLEHELMGQISDGAWENAGPRDHYEDWAYANVQVGGQGTKGISSWAKRNYNFQNSSLLSVVGDRMMAMARLIKKWPSLASIANTYSSEYLVGRDKGNIKSIKEFPSYAQKYVKKLLSKTKEKI